jgi:phage baseplate assembly protein W
VSEDRTFFGRGWPFPVKPGPNGRMSLLGGEEKIRQSIWLILSTAPGERQMRPDFGCGIHDLVFQPNTAALRGVVRARVQDALVRWEPRIDVVDVRVETPPEAQNYLLIRIDYRVRINNAFYNLVYPFFINEGVG